MTNDDNELPEDREQSAEIDANEAAHLLAELRQLGRMLDPVPAHVLFAARGSLAWLRVDAELAELSFDSMVDGDLELAGVRGGGDGVRLVSFDGADFTIEVEVDGIGDRRRLVGQLVPPQVATIELRSASEPNQAGAVTRADTLGRFRLDRVGGGPASLRCSLESGRTIETGWLVI